MAEGRELDRSYLYLVSAILAMEPSRVLLSLARDCGGGSITEKVQSFIWENCISKADENFHIPYLKSYLKKLIVEIESHGNEVLDELYGWFACYMTSSKGDGSAEGNSRVLKCISFLLPDDCSELPSCPQLRKLVVPLQCSLNMLEGDTGCSIWPSSLFLSEFILSHPEIFSNKSCFEVGSGVGLVGICLTHVKASEVVLSDGDLSSLANMKLNLELNQLSTGADLSESSVDDPLLVKCIHLPWESAVESELQGFMPDVILGADVIYDPLCLPHLVRLLSFLLNREKPYPHNAENSNHCSDTRRDGTAPGNGSGAQRAAPALQEGPVAYVASVIRNVDTFNCFLALAKAKNLNVEDVTENFVPSNLLPYMHSYDRSSVRLFALSHFCVPDSSEKLRGLEEEEEEMEAKQEEVEVIHSWSAPRSLSTSLMYSFAQRDDTEVLDEPLYGHFLHVTGVGRPYREEVLSKLESDGSKVVKDVIFGPGVKKYRFCKHMSKQRLPGLSDELMKNGKHFILIRNPLEILQSFDKVVPPSFLELGLADLVSIYSELCQLGKLPPVIDAADLQQDPEATLRCLCEDLDIPFQAAMLKWEAGPKSIDGVWAPWWYSSVHKSTGFTTKRKYPSPFPFSLYDLLEQSLPFYNMLKCHARGSSLLKPHLPLPSLPVPANEKLLVWVGDEIIPRDSAKVSVFDSVVQGGDSVWEGLRIYNGKIFKLEEHLDRLFDSAKALAFNNVPTREEVKEAIFNTLIRNGMFDNAHIRLSLTRGKKVTSGMSPAFNLYGCTLIVLAEWKPPVYDNAKGITLVTATTRRNSPNNLDSKIHHNNLLNNILAKIEGNNANADDAIMLDKDGYVSETNATNIFLVKKGRVLTPHADYCLPGVTRATVMDLVVKENIILEERRISLSEFHTADEVWTTGTMGELSPVLKIDGREIGDGQVGPVTRRLQIAYKNLTEGSGVPIPTYQEA
ncbi:branched-chain-amino-acid aminotransferase-like protein 1 [Diospyros lotus]|uniref:branched-chain-amino-acid aminotransferase-like protein 1 n=1 Tax=Diospyros lotus TaxID=55363 RepID=UPI00225B120D|nr:branched-chain-amino-acid aminotransferase-like protein 1 [Diospyros lotus]